MIKKKIKKIIYPLLVVAGIVGFSSFFIFHIMPLQYVLMSCVQEVTPHPDGENYLLGMREREVVEVFETEEEALSRCTRIRGKMFIELKR